MRRGGRSLVTKVLGLSAPSGPGPKAGLQNPVPKAAASHHRIPPSPGCSDRYFTLVLGPVGDTENEEVLFWGFCKEKVGVRMGTVR